MNDSETTETHAGYEFEDGMFSRLRSWVDVAPWIRLARVPRLLASPGHVGLVIVATVTTMLIARSMLGGSPASLTLTTVGSIPIEWMRSLESVWGLVFLTLCWLIWTPVVQTVGRGGAALVAGVGLPGAGASLRLALRRLWMSYLVWVVPFLCVAVMALLLFLAGVPALVLSWDWLAMASGWLVGLAAVPVGVLGFGALIAIPYALIAMTCEPDPDVFDSLSRGYEFLYRRPLQLVWYGLVAFLLLYIASWLIGGVGAAASLVVALIAQPFPADSVYQTAALTMIGIATSALQNAFAIALLGGSYLLLRRDAGGQEVEDFWIPPRESDAALPSLPEKAFET